MQGEGAGLGERQEAGVIAQPHTLQSLDAPRPPSIEGLTAGPAPWAPKRDGAVAAASHPIKGMCLAESVPHVKTGTPLKPLSGRWVIAGPFDRPSAFAGNHYTGGDNMVGYRAITLETYERQFHPLDRYFVVAVDDWGNLQFRRHNQGSYLATSETQIILDVHDWREPPAPVQPAEVVMQPEVPLVQGMTKARDLEAEEYERIKTSDDEQVSPLWGEDGR